MNTEPRKAVCPHPVLSDGGAIPQIQKTVQITKEIYNT